LQFGRQEGEMVEVFHGARWYTNERYTGPTTFDYPPEWDAYPGHYRSHNPWHTNFRIVLRKGKLVLIEPAGSEEPMIPLNNGTFRLGTDRANLSCCDYYRTFTP
jgi:hypothetical protein